MSAALSASRAFGDEPRGESPYKTCEEARFLRNLGGTAELFVPGMAFGMSVLLFCFLAKSKMRNVK